MADNTQVSITPKLGDSVLVTAAKNVATSVCRAALGLPSDAGGWLLRPFLQTGIL